MALARVKTWIDGETLTASDLNAEFNNILNNPVSLISPLTAALDVDGFTITWDAAAATTSVSSTSVSWNFTSGNKTGTPSTSGSVARYSAQTFTDSATAGSGTATAQVFWSLARPTLAATNASVTTTDAATAYIANAPAAGTNETITRSWALWIDDGAVRFDGYIFSPISSDVYSADTTGAELRLRKSRSATQEGQTVVQSGDDLGSITAYGSDGTNFETAAQILFEVDTTPGNNDMPGRIVFSTTADGANSLTEAWRIDSGQRLIGGGSAVVAVGSGSPEFQLVKTTPQMGIHAFDTLGGGEFVFSYTRNATASSHTALNLGDTIGKISFYGSDGTDFTDPSASIIIFADDTFASNDTPTRFVLSLCPNGSSTQTERLYISSGGKALFNDTANANSTAGLTVNQGAADDHAFTLKSSDVATALTTITAGADVETDDFFVVEKRTAATGGARISALAESAEDSPLIVETYGGAPVTTDTSSSLAAMYFIAAQHDGANALADMAANSNLVAFAEREAAGTGATRMLLKADDGELHLGNTTLVALDHEDDVQLVRAMQKSSASSGIKISQYDNPFYDYQKLRKVGLAGEMDASGFFLFPLQPRLHAHEGAIWQLHCRLAELEGRLLGGSQ